MIFQKNEFFKEHKVLVSKNLKSQIFNLCSLLSDNFDEFNINKFTIVLSKNTNVNVAINNDTNRKNLILKKIETCFGTTILKNTKINDVNYSDIPMVLINGNKDFDTLIDDLKKLITPILPEKYQIGTHAGSIYIIFNKNHIGNLWNIHSDPFPAKCHLTLTPCNEEFIWFNENQPTIKKLKHNKIYLFNVNILHTVKILNYIKNNPRIHIVYDIIQTNQ